MPKDIMEIIISKEGELTSAEALTEFQNNLYMIACHYYEHLGEYGNFIDNKKLRGNGHNMAQDLSKYVGNYWNDRLRDK
jgi:hypothetical protein